MTPAPKEPEFGIANEAFEDIDEVSESKKSDTIVSSQSSTDSSKQTKKKKKIKEKPEQPPVSLLELFRFATLADILIIVAASLCAAASGICLPIVIILYGDLTDSFVNGGLNETYVYNLTCGNISGGANETLPPPDTDSLQDTFQTFGIYTSILATILLILGFAFVTLLNYVAENQVYRVRKHFFSAILRQDIAWFDTKSSNDFASRITEDLNKIQDGIGEKIGMLIFSAATFLSTTIIAFIHGWQLTLVMMVSTPVLAVAMGVVAKVQSSLTESELKAYAKSGGVAEEVLNSIRTVMAFNGQQKEVDRFQKNLEFARKAGVKRGLATATGSGLTNGILYSSFALAFWYGITLILDACNNYNAYSASDLLIVFFNVLIGAMQIGQAAPYLEALNVARGAAATIFSVIDRVPPIDSSSKEGETPKKLEGRIKFEEVRFNYPSRLDVKILQGLSFEISPGQTVALVGSSGCGKSTCIQLVQRFYDPLEGTVKVDGTDIKQLNLAWLRSKIGVVGQEPVLFGTTIGENIRYGRDGVTHEEIERAAKEANAYDYIQRLPKKFETMVGERGAQLSGGQKQRIAIARALVRNPKILLLDEATSALDTQSEAVVQKALDKARLGRTTIIVAHRLTTIRNADRIIVLKQGVVEEDGTHPELMEKQGVYYNLVLAQQGGKLDLVETETSLEEESSDEDEESKINSSLAIQNHKLEDIDAISANFPHGLGSIRRKNYRLSLTSTEGSDEDPEQDVSLFEILKMNKKEWPFILLGTLGAVVNGATTLVYAILFGEVLGVLTPSGDEELQAQKQEEGNFYALMFLILGIVSGIAAFVQSFSFSVAGEALTSRLRDLTFQTILKQEVAYFDQDSNSVGALCARMSGDASSVQGATGSRIGVICQAISTLVLSIILSLYYDWRLGLVATAFIPLVFISTYFQGKVIMSQSALERKALQKSSKVALEAIGNVRTVASLGKEEMFHRMYVDALRDPHRSAKKKSWVRGAIFGFANSIPMYSYAATLSYGAWLVTYAGVPFENVIKVTEALTFGTQTIAQALAFAPNYNKAKVAAGRIFSLLSREPKIDATSKEGALLSDVDGNVDYESVEFRYPTRKGVQILQGLSLAVKAGQTVALVGHSGCGKSTCIQLLERFYDPDAGEVKMDRKNIKEINISSLRSKLGIVSQEPILFNMTLRENIEYGDNSRQVPMDEVIEAARKANIHSFIQSLPNGYETMVGERGTQLSGGQKQRIAIARALVRNPKILLLDEATSALDSESEKVVQMALDAAREGRTCITIAHRLSTIQNADNIIVFNNGKVQEQGTHEELIKLGGIYYELCTVQGISPQ